MIRTRSYRLPVLCVLALAILSGCESDRSSNIPSNATVASSGDNRLSFTASAYGTVWVYDVSNDRIDYSGPVALNDSMTVDPDSNSITINGRVVNDRLKSGKHRIYFVPGQQTQGQ